MSLRRRGTAGATVLTFIAVSGLVLSGVHAQSMTVPHVKRPVTVADAIRMTRVGNWDPVESRSWQEGTPAVSPDGTRAAIVLRKGDIEHNANVYSLFGVQTDTTPNAPVAKFLVSFSSSSNREAIRKVQWLPDDDTILFLGENQQELTQLYTIQYSTTRLRKLTHHHSSVTSYSTSAAGKEIVYAAEKPTREVSTDDVLRRGFRVPANIVLSELVAGHVVQRGASDNCELFIQENEAAKEIPLAVSGRLALPEPHLFLSPDGKYLVLPTFVREIDPLWRQYNNSFLRSMMDTHLANGTATWIARYELVDVESGSRTVLVDAPIGSPRSELMWSPDSQSVIATGIQLPLIVPDQKKREARRATTFIAEIKIPGGEINEITAQNLKLVGWEKQAGLWKFEERYAQGNTDGPLRPVYYRKTSSGWEKVENLSRTEAPTGWQVYVDEGLNTPPGVVAQNRQTGQRSMVFDLNPEFSELAIGKVEDIKWNDGAGHEINAGLYLPPDYRPTGRYPLVIQTHGYHPHEFWIDGPYTTAFAAQPLASKGILVLQLPELAIGTAEEGERNMRAMESAIDYLDQRGIVDRKLVGLIGFSRTCYHVKYALTHSKFHFAAASVAEGVDAGYLQYVVNANLSPSAAADAETLNGGASPFGEGLSAWLRHSPGFLLDRVDTPLEIQANAPGSLLGEWEWFSGLSRLGKPVDFIYIPGGTHPLEKPWERMVSQQTNVDWFVFWLKGEEDPDPAKAKQYGRWREMRKRSEQAKVAPRDSGNR